jgi:hypothetical protein
MVGEHFILIIKHTYMVSLKLFEVCKVKVKVYGV